MQIQKTASAVLQQVQSFKNNGYSHLDPSPYSEGLTLKEVKERTDRVLVLLPDAIQEASDHNGWKTDDRYDPPTDQVAAQLDLEVQRVQCKKNQMIGSAAAMGAGVAGGILTAAAGLPGWVGVVAGVVGFGGLACGIWHSTEHELYNAKELRQAAQDLRDWGSLP
ncbi:hypothetical protein JST97_15820 [bacterium]|nr:hypothetical protein [bacterium]